MLFGRFISFNFYQSYLCRNEFIMNKIFRDETVRATLSNVRLTIHLMEVWLSLLFLLDSKNRSSLYLFCISSVLFCALLANEFQIEKKFTEIESFFHHCSILYEIALFFEFIGYGEFNLIWERFLAFNRNGTPTYWLHMILTFQLWKWK